MGTTPFCNFAQRKSNPHVAVSAYFSLVLIYSLKEYGDSLCHNIKFLTHIIDICD